MTVQNPSGASATAANINLHRAGAIRVCTLLLGISALVPGQSNSLRILTWNIDRGTHVDIVAKVLAEQKPDIALLQEVDCHTLRANNLDVAAELARRTQLHFAYATEFEELSQAAPGSHAYTGQATLSRFPIRTSRILRFQHQSGFWKPRAWILSSLPLVQRRLGARIALISEIEAPGSLLVIYNLHLESRSYGRIQFQQLDEVLADVRKNYGRATAVLIGGDLNSKYPPGRYLEKMGRAGFQSATGLRLERTHTIAMALDWLFVRGSFEWRNGQVLRDAGGSDHYPVRGELLLQEWVERPLRCLQGPFQAVMQVRLVTQH